MSQVSEIIGYIDPIYGDNLTAKPGNSSLSYTSIDFFYNQQRDLDPTVYLTAQIAQSNVSLDLIEYVSLLVTNPARNAKLTITGLPNDSIKLVLINLQIDTDLIIPVGGGNLPIIQTGISFIFDNDYSLNIIEASPNFSNPWPQRTIFDHNSLIAPSIVVIRQSGSKIVMSRSGDVHFGGVLVDIDSPSSAEFVPDSCYHQASIDTIALNITFRENASYKIHPRLVPKKSNGECDYDFALTKAKLARSIFFSIITVGIWLVVAGVGDSVHAIIQSVNKCPSLRSGKEVSLNKLLRQKCLKHISNTTHPKILSMSKYILSQLDDGGKISQIQGGTVSGNGPGKLYLTDDPTVQINDINLVNCEPFTTSEIAGVTEFNMKLQNNSYYNTGSIFRRPFVITKDYTHTQFDGEIFLVDLSNCGTDIVITIPAGDVSNNRVFEYKRIDESHRRVIIKSINIKIPLDNKFCDCKIKRSAYVKLIGYNDKIIIMK